MLRRLRPRVNVAPGERAASVAAGAILGASGLIRRDGPGWVLAGLGGALLFRGVSGHCPTYARLGMGTATAGDDGAARAAERGIEVRQAFLIGRPADELYAFWRDFTNLPRIMGYLERVDALDDRRSHWVAKAPRIAGGRVEWDAEITKDEPGAAIAWRTLPGSQVAMVGEIRFTRALGDRGTEVHVAMEYLPPAGRLGHLMAALSGLSPRRQVREELRNFKRLMEVGELPTTAGQPRGTCLGSGRREPAAGPPPAAMP